MGTKKETSLQQRIQKFIESKGGYVNKNWGSMTSEPGIADLTSCYRGLYLAIEVKVDNNEPTKAQGIHARNVCKADGITAVVWAVEEVQIILGIIDHYLDLDVVLPIGMTIDHIKKRMRIAGIDDGTRY